ncbi:MAG: 2-amino-4-hydroxy-6-hydroxymethyldihydropteridine diphosphokinase [Rhodospirillaceae bacterium]|nr:2-amino-4-hydroxy-6-hydroxymethyldihydropteridine diphosphokinase [Rhodospirillaceae bacterium]
MKLIGLGSNLPAAPWGEPIGVCRAALARFPEVGMTVVDLSRWYRTAPVPASDQPWFVNGVARIETTLDARDTLDALLSIEAAMGRRRLERWGPRVIDLDLLAWDDRVTAETDTAAGLVLPHPRLYERAFVLKPLADVAPDWRDPRSGQSVDRLLAALPSDQTALPFDER